MNEVAVAEKVEVEAEVKQPKIGRPTTYTPELVEQTLAYFRGGGSFHGVDDHDDLPSYGALCLWKEAHPSFMTALARARADGAAKRFDRAVERTWNADEKEKAYCARVALMGAEAQAKAMCPEVYAPATNQNVNVNIGIVGVLEVVEDRRRQRVTSQAKVIDHDDALGSDDSNVMKSKA